MAAGDWKRPSGPTTPTGSRTQAKQKQQAAIKANGGKTTTFNTLKDANKPTDWNTSKANNTQDRTQFTTHGGVSAGDIRDRFNQLQTQYTGEDGKIGSGFADALKAEREKYGISSTELGMALQPSSYQQEDWDRYFSNSGDMTRVQGGNLTGQAHRPVQPSSSGVVNQPQGLLSGGAQPVASTPTANNPVPASQSSALPPSSQTATAAATSAPSSNRTAEIQQHIQWLKNDKGLTGDALNQRIYEDAQRYGISANQLTEAMGTSLSGYADYLNRNGLADLPGTNYTGTGDGVVGTGSTSNTTQPQAQQNARDAYYNGNNVPNQTEGGVSGTMFLDGPGSPTAMAAQTETRTVAPEETSQYQLEKMLGSDSQLMQRAEALSNEQMNARGLLNSSMAAEAAQGAMIDAAQPYVLNDANTYAKASMDNMTATNQTNLQNASQFNDMLYDNYSSNKDRAFEAGQTDQAQAFEAEQRALDRDFDQAMQGLDNDIKIRLQEMSDTSAMLRQKSAENAELTKTEKTQLAGMYATYMSARSDVMSADLKLEHKNMMISKMDSQFINDIAAYTDLTGFSVPEEFFTNMGAGGNTGTGNNGLLGAYYDPTIAAQYVGGAQEYIPGTRNQATKDS